MLQNYFNESENASERRKLQITFSEASRLLLLMIFVLFAELVSKSPLPTKSHLKFTPVFS